MGTSIVAKILSLAGLTGSNPATNAFIPPSRHSAASQDEFDKAGEVANPDILSSYNSATARPRTLEEQLRIWDEMSHWDLMAAALGEITDEATQVDATSPALVWYECTDKKVEEELNQMLLDVGAEETVRSQVWNTAAMGNHFEKLEYTPGEGVKGFSIVHPMEIRRYWLKRNRRCVGFRWQGNLPRKDEIFKIGNSPILRAALKLGSSSAQDDLENLWYPWDFMHIRRMHRSRQTEHGEPLFEEAQGIYKKLRMAIDQMVVHRAQVQPDRYVVNIDVKDLPPIDQLKVVNRWKQSLRSKLSFGSGTSGAQGQPDDFKAFYNAMALDTILWIAKPRDFGHTIDKLAGTTSVPDIYDIEMLTNLFFSIIGMPKSWIGLGDPGKDGGPISGKALLAQDMRFLRKIKSIRQPILTAYTWLGYFHCMLRGYDVSSLEIKAMMPPIGGLEDQMKIELLSKQTEVLSALGDIMPKFGLPKEAWIDVVFRKYMHLPDEIVDAFLTALPAEVEPAVESLSPEQKLVNRLKPTVHASSKLIVEELVKKIGAEKEGVLHDMQDILHGRIPHRRQRYRTQLDILRPATLSEGDLIVAGFGQFDPFKDFKLSDANTPATTVTERLVQHPGYRSIMDAHLRRHA
jgi:hypothetical protein